MHKLIRVQFVKGEPTIKFSP